jgi:hypothetical protein
MTGSRIVLESAVTWSHALSESNVYGTLASALRRWGALLGVWKVRAVSAARAVAVSSAPDLSLAGAGGGSPSPRGEKRSLVSLGPLGSSEVSIVPSGRGEEKVRVSRVERPREAVDLLLLPIGRLPLEKRSWGDLTMGTLGRSFPMSPTGEVARDFFPALGVPGCWVVAALFPSAFSD